MRKHLIIFHIKSPLFKFHASAPHLMSVDMSSMVAMTSPVVLLVKPVPSVPTTTHTPSGLLPHL